MTPGRLVMGALVIGVVIGLVTHWVKPQPEGVWFGIGIFVFGWIFTAALTVRGRIKEHSFDLILRTRFEESYHESARALTSAFKNVDIVNMGDAHKIYTSEEDDDITLTRNVSNLLNFYEILSISVYYKDADERIIKEYFHDLLTRMYLQLQHFVPLWREGDPEAFVYLEWLYKKWTK